MNQLKMGQTEAVKLKIMGNLENLVLDVCGDDPINNISDSIHLDRRVFHPTPPLATLLGFHLLLFSLSRLETVGDRYGYGPFFPPNYSIWSFRCTFSIYRFLWRGFLCHCSFLGKARHCDYQPWTKPRWRKK
jgi:hypothetical protein